MAIEVDVNDRTRTPCQTPGCNWPNFHVCLFGKEEAEPMSAAMKEFHAAGGRSHKGRKVTFAPDHINNLVAAQQERWDRYRDEMKPRDDKIVARYAEGGVSMLTIQREFGVSRNTVLKVLRHAQSKGKVKIRPRGTTIAHEAKKAS